MYAEVIVDIVHTAVDRLFTYRIPDDMIVEPGMRVLVPFGAGKRRQEGFVWRIMEHADTNGIQIKTIERTLDPYPVLCADQLALAGWIRSMYHCVLADALRLMIPAELRGERIREKTIRTVLLAPGTDTDALLASFLTKRGSVKSPKQHAVVSLLASCTVPMAVADIVAMVPGAQGAVRTLLDRGVLVEDGCVSFRRPYADTVQTSAPLALSEAQQQAYEKILSCVDAQGGTVLLHGVTGSGKTEVYLQAIAAVLESGGGAIVLVPEIALTAQTVRQFRDRFGDSIAVLHSRLSAGERYDEWRRIRLGRARVVIGARSAIFAPVADLKLIVIDEEHEASYQSEMTPRYHAAEVALKRAKLCSAAVVLGSATPSVSSYQRARKGRYQLVEMPQRVKDLPMPGVEIVDMRKEFQAGNASIFSGALQKKMERCFAAGEQAILFINRRGYSTFVSCRGCGHVFKCPDCDISMTYHKQENRLKCHFCGKSMSLPRACPSCGKPYIKGFGIGTQQVEEQMRERFPAVRTLRMDMDTTGKKNAHADLLAAFRRGEAQVLIGTQMIAKGLDIPNVTLVGVVAADATLHIPDYRSSERTFELLTQVAGRAGRDARRGSVVIQTYTPEHPVLHYASKHDYKSFYTYEMAQRRQALLPPYSLFVRALFTGEDAVMIEQEANALADALFPVIRDAIKAHGGQEEELLMLLSAPSPVRRRRGLYRHQVLIKLLRSAHTASALEAIYACCDTVRSRAFLALEVNPADLF